MSARSPLNCGVDATRGLGDRRRGGRREDCTRAPPVRPSRMVVGRCSRARRGRIRAYTSGNVSMAKKISRAGSKRLSSTRWTEARRQRGVMRNNSTCWPARSKVHSGRSGPRSSASVASPSGESRQDRRRARRASGDAAAISSCESSGDIGDLETHPECRRGVASTQGGQAKGEVYVQRNHVQRLRANDRPARAA